MSLQPAKRQKTTHGNCSRIPPSPDWSDCPNFGKDIAGFIIPSKSPLGEDCNIDAGKSCSLKQMITAHRNLGLIIDLTNTTPYYSLQELDRVKHIKIPCDSVPDNDSANQFVYEVSKFAKHSTKQILVHCTHGFNRTGYMIAHYLKRVQPNMPVPLAIKIFADARPPGIRIPEYIEALHSFYHEEKPDKTLPLPKHDSGINGGAIPQKQQLELRLSCYKLLKLPVGEGGLQFPGSRSVSVTRKTVEWLRKINYRATWKTDGTRYLMLLTENGCYLIDSKFEFRRVQMRFPCTRTNDDILAEVKLHHMTLLDGEMVIDTVPGSGKQERRFLVCDMMAINGVSISELPFSERWNMVEKEVVEPRNYERRLRNPYYYKYELEAFRLRRKHFCVFSSVPELLKDFIPKLCHPADGLVFQAWNDSYAPGPHHNLLKWNDARNNSDVNVTEEMLLCEIKKIRSIQRENATGLPCACCLIETTTLLIDLKNQYCS